MTIALPPALTQLVGRLVRTSRDAEEGEVVREALRNLFLVIRSIFAAELGHQPTALTHFRQIGNLASLPAERDFIARRIAEL